jgi:hypothetical protein
MRQSTTYRTRRARRRRQAQIEAASHAAWISVMVGLVITLYAALVLPILFNLPAPMPPIDDLPLIQVEPIPTPSPRK